MTKKINRRNNHIAPELYAFYLHLKKTLGAQIVHRRRRASNTCIEIIFMNTLFEQLTGRLNTLPEAEACGYWIMCRPQTKRGHAIYRNHAVYQLFLTPVHPKKRKVAKYLAAQASIDVTFEPIQRRSLHAPTSKLKNLQIYLHMSIFCSNFAAQLISIKS